MENSSQPFSMNSLLILPHILTTRNYGVANFWFVLVSSSSSFPLHGWLHHNIIEKEIAWHTAAHLTIFLLNTTQLFVIKNNEFHDKWICTCYMYTYFTYDNDPKHKWLNAIIHVTWMLFPPLVGMLPSANALGNIPTSGHTTLSVTWQNI